MSDPTNILNQAPNPVDAGPPTIETDDQSLTFGPEFDAALARSRGLADNGEFDVAEEVIEDLISGVTDHELLAALRLTQGRLCAHSKRWKDAAARFDLALAELPTTPDVNNERHDIQLEKAKTLATVDIDLVAKDLDELDIAWKTPGWPMPIDIRINGLIAAGRFEVALDWLAQRLSQTELAAHPAAFLHRAELMIKLGRLDLAFQECVNAIATAPASDDARAWSAIINCATFAQSPTTVIAAYQRLLEIEPSAQEDPDLRVLTALAYLTQGHAENALSLIKDVRPTVPAMVANLEVCRARALERLDRKDDALVATLQSLAKLQKYSETDIPPESLLTIRVLRAQLLNEKGNNEEGTNGKVYFDGAVAAASQAIDSSTPANPTVPDLPVILRLGALMQRSLALYRLNRFAEAQRDVNSAIADYEVLRHSRSANLFSRVPDYETLETSLWYAKGVIFDAQKRNEEALSAYTRAERLENRGAAAAIALGSSLVKTGAINEALAMFDRALGRASSNLERASALAGKGRAWVRLRRYENAITDLQAALDARVSKPADDPKIFEQLGIAYNALQRSDAARVAFERAWNLTSKKTANLARGVTAAHLGLNDPEAALDLLNKLPERLRRDRTLLFNRALALDALGRRREAIRDLVRAKEAGLDRATDQLALLDAPAGLGRWTHYWFGAQASWARFAFGLFLLLMGATGLLAPFIQWRLRGTLDWYLMLLPSVVALVLLALPNIKLFTFEAQGVKLSAEPFEATGREAANVSAPETFNVPMMDEVMAAVPDTKV